MPALHPFRGWRYDPDAAGPLDRLATPPYDVISPDERARMASASRFNLVHLTLPEEAGEQDRYENAARLLGEWRDVGALTRDAVPCFTRHRQTYRLAGGTERRTRTGLLGLLEIGDLAEGTVRPHERTLAGPRQDRQRLMETTHAHLSPIFMIASDHDGAFHALLEQGRGGPADRFTDEDGIVHTVERLDDPEFARHVAELLGNRPMLIADGHHRFESASACQRTLAGRTDVPVEVAREAGRVLVEVVSSASPGLTVLPTHRLVAGVVDFAVEKLIGAISGSGSLTLETVPAAGGSLPADLADRLLAAGPGTLGIVADRPPRAWLAQRMDGAEGAGDPEARLDVVFLHRRLLGEHLGIGDDAVEHGSQLRFVKDVAAAVGAVADGSAQVAFLLNATPMADLDAVTAAGKRMPQKSTYFYPKVPAGLVLHTFD